MITLHYLNNSRSQRILWLLEELQVQYAMKKYERSAQGQAPPELLKINPLGKAPVITDGEVVLAESGVIIIYLISKYGDGKAAPPKSGFLDNLYWTHYAEGSLMPVITQKFIFDFVPKNAPFIMRPLVKAIFGQLNKLLVEAELKRHIPMIEAHLAKSESMWFAGGNEPTSADYQMSFPLEILVTLVPDMVGPRIKRYVLDIQDRTAYKKALAMGGEYSFANH